jgi:hypothetical protein
MNAIPEERRRSRKTERALAIADGTSVAGWARGNQVPKRPASKWSLWDDPDFFPGQRIFPRYLLTDHPCRRYL